MKYSEEFLEQLNRYKHKVVYAKVTALSFDEAPIETIEGRITSGSINVDGNSAVRRTCQFSIVADNFDYRDYIWGAKTKFKLEIGLHNFINSQYEDIIWFPQGIFVISSFNVSRSATNFTLSISGKDKMCLLNGEFGGSIESAVDFGSIEEESSDGVWTIRKIPIKEIIRNMIHVYAKEPYHNIIINDLDTYGIELLEYRYDIPLYLYRKVNNLAYENALIESSEKKFWIQKDGAWKNISLKDLTPSDLEPLITTLNNEDIEPTKVYESNNSNGQAYYFTKVEYGQTAGYKETDLIYPGDLITKVGDSITSVLDKLKNMLVEFEYFYNLYGQFVFQKKQSFTSIMWSMGDSVTEDKMPEIVAANQMISYNFTNHELFTAFNNNPNIGNLKNDYSVWGTRRSISGQELPVHLRYAIDNKPTYYKAFDGTTYIASEIADYDTETQNVISTDWREIIYQMALDYYKYNNDPNHNYEAELRENNGNLYPTGRTGYEQYYTDLEGFWRQLYYPLINSDYSTAQSAYADAQAAVNQLTELIYGKKVDSYLNNIGGLENDLSKLVEKMKESDDAAKALIHYWMTKTEKPSYVEDDDSWLSPKYGITVPNSEVSLYYNILQTKYFQEKNNLKNKQKELDTKKSKYESLKSKVEEQFYVADEYKGTKRMYWNKNVFEFPSSLDFWFDFLDTNGPLSKYCVRNIGSRPKAIQDTNVKSIYFRETPDIVYVPNSQEYENLSGYKVIQAPGIESMFRISAQGKSAKERLDELLYQHTHCAETATITTIPIYYLQPNTRIKVVDEKSHLNGDYIINKISVPLTYNGTMSLTITKAVNDIV